MNFLPGHQYKITVDSGPTFEIDRVSVREVLPNEELGPELVTGEADVEGWTEQRKTARRKR